jgi:plasmid stability protein
MANLLIRDIPDELYARLKKLAQRNGRTVSAEVLFLLEQILEKKVPANGQRERLIEQRRQAMERIIERMKDQPRSPVDSVTLLREDRDR